MGPHAGVMVGYRRLRPVVAEGAADFGAVGVAVVLAPAPGQTLMQSKKISTAPSRSPQAAGQSSTRVGAALLS